MSGTREAQATVYHKHRCLLKRKLKWKQNLGIFNIDTYQKKVKSTEPTDTVESEE